MIYKYISNVILWHTIMVSDPLQLAGWHVTLGTLMNLSERIHSFKK